jgi:hypothetical protein
MTYYIFRARVGCDHLLLRHRHRIKECLHRRFAEAPASLMRPLFTVFSDPQGLQLID